MKTIVIKIGSSSLTDKKGRLDIKNLNRLAAEISKLKKNGINFVIVTSGAIVTGAEKIGKTSKPKTIPEKQAAAAIGQSILMREYSRAFAKNKITVAQILLTRDAIADRERYINSRNTIKTLIEHRVIPIINENDTVSIDEIKVGDNDNLSALVASLINADLLINLTDVDGFIMDSDEGVPYRAETIEKIDEQVKKSAGIGGEKGTGGMITKIQAAEVCSDAGIPMVIAHCRKKGIIEKIIAGEIIGTKFIPKASKKESKKRWLAHGLPVSGEIVIDAGAISALLKSGKSLLAAGIKKVSGKFKAGDSISIRDGAGKEIGRGLSNYNAHELDLIKGKKSQDIPQVLGFAGQEEVVHRDNLVIL